MGNINFGIDVVEFDHLLFNQSSDEVKSNRNMLCFLMRSFVRAKCKSTKVVAGAVDVGAGKTNFIK